MTASDALVAAVTRHLLLVVRESLTIAGEVGRPVEAVHAILDRLEAECDSGIALTRPYPGEPRVVGRGPCRG
jgi:hypothetical protein